MYVLCHKQHHADATTPCVVATVKIELYTIKKGVQNARTNLRIKTVFLIKHRVFRIRGEGNTKS